MSVRRLDEIAGRNPDSPARRSRVAKRAPLCGGRRSSRRGREAAWQIWSGSPDWRRKGGVGVVTAVGDSGRLFGPASTSGWMPGGSGRVEVRIHSTARYAPLQGPHPLRIVRRGAWKPSERDSTPVERQVAVSVRRPHGTTRRSPTHSPGGAAWRSAPALRGTPVESARPLQAREAAWQIRSGFPASGGRAGGRCTKAVPGWDGFRRQFVVDDFDFRLDAGGLREGRGPHPLDGALCSAPRAASPTNRAKGCLETRRKGLGFSRAAGVAVSVRRPHGTTRRSPTHLLGGAELRNAPAVGRQRRSRTSRSGRSRLSASPQRPRGGANRAALASGGSPVHEGAIRGRGRVPPNDPPPADFNDWFEDSRGSETVAVPKPTARVRRRAMLRSKGRILYDRAKGCLETQPKGTRLRSSGRLSGACPAAPRDYQAQSQLICSAEPSCETRPPCGRLRSSRGGRSRPGRRHGRSGVVFPASGGRAGGRFTKAVPGWERVPPQVVAGDLDFRLDAGGLREGRGPHPLDGALCSASRVASSTTRAKGCLETQPKGTRLRSSGRLSGACPAAPRDYQAQSQLTSSADPSRGAWPPCGRRRRSRASRGGRPRRSANRRRGHVAGSKPPPPRGGSTVHQRRYVARGGFRQNGPQPATSATGSTSSRLRDGRAPKPAVRVRRCAILRSKGRILYDSCEGVPGNLAEGTRLRSSGRSCGACQAAPRDYQAQSHPLSPHGPG